MIEVAGVAVAETSPGYNLVIFIKKRQPWTSFDSPCSVGACCLTLTCPQAGLQRSWVCGPGVGLRGMGELEAASQITPGTTWAL